MNNEQENESTVKQLSYLIGTEYSSETKNTVANETRRTKVYKSGECMLRDYDLNRIHIVVDKNNKITGFRFG
jgi:Peptidase inhibitor I78 family.